MSSKEITTCQICSSINLYKFIDFGQMPKPNVYLTREQVGEQTTYQLGAYLCQSCGLVQLDRIVPSKDLFIPEYAYRTPEVMRANFQESVDETLKMTMFPIGSRVLEIGSGVGIALQEYKKRGMQVMGVDPAEECADEANRQGITTLAKPFTFELAKTLDKYNIITASNVLQHIPDIRGTFEAISFALAPDGVFVLEFPYLGDILQDLAFDSFYAEHYYYLSLSPLQQLCKSLGLSIVRAKRLPNIHLGSMRVWIKRDYGSTRELITMMKDEKDQGFMDQQRYDEFLRRTDENMHQLQEHLYIAKMRGEKIVAHGASAKFVTLTNYGHIGSNMIEYVADNTPYKQGKYTPGMGIPVVSEEQMILDAPDIIVCGIRNFYEQSQPLYDTIKRRNPKCKILLPIPEVTYG